MESYKKQFHTNPLVNPKTGEEVKINSKEYKKLTDKYGDVKIKSPKTGSKITVGKGEYNKLIKTGYTHQQLLSQVEIISPKKLLTPFDVQDIKYEILLKLSYPDILKYCASNKTICDNQLWKLLIERDFPGRGSDDDNAKILYKQYFDFYDKWVTIIMADFMIYKTKYIDMTDVYNKIKHIINQYYNDEFDINWDEDKENNYILQNTLELETFYKIFDILSIPIVKNIEPSQIKPPRHAYNKYTDIDKIKHLSYLFSLMFDEMIDI
jgi:hypothetical protein